MIETSDRLVSIVIPCFNEEDNIIPIFEELELILRGINFEVIFIDDCSSDSTLQIIENLCTNNLHVKFISLSRNFGHQNALKAGFDFARGACVISMDADLQHPTHILPEMLEKWEQGYEIVYTIRLDRENSTSLKKETARLFYKILNGLTEVKVPPGSADFRLLDRKIIDIFKNDIKEYHLFYRGLIRWIGFNQISISFTPNYRLTGKSKYSFRKMVRLASDGITSFSIRPLKVATVIGLLLTFFSAIYTLYVIYMALFTEEVVRGWSSVLVSVLFLGGMNMVLLGIIGEYIGKIYMQSKERPHYLIKKKNIETD